MGWEEEHNVIVGHGMTDMLTKIIREVAIDERRSFAMLLQHMVEDITEPERVKAAMKVAGISEEEAGLANSAIAAFAIAVIVQLKKKPMPKVHAQEMSPDEFRKMMKPEKGAEN